jgi:general secretion pathway protein G
MLAAVAAPQIMSRMGQGKDNVAKIQISELESALQIFSFDMGRFPTTAEGLQALVQNPTGSDSWDGPYLRRGLPMDPWGRPYVYKSPGDHGPFDLFSVGADGIEGTADDITNWN